MDTKLHVDSEIIMAKGGPSAVAKRLGYVSQRVQNWMYRGIPAKVQLENAWLRRKRDATRGEK